MSTMLNYALTILVIFIIILLTIGIYYMISFHKYLKKIMKENEIEFEKRKRKMEKFHESKKL